MRKFGLLILTGAVLFWAFGTVTANTKIKEGAIIEEGTVIEKDSKDGSIQRAVFKVQNLTCGACFTNINAVLAPLEGFSGMGANLFRNLVAVDFVGTLSAEQIGAAITQKGYPATLESVEPIMEKESFAYLNILQKGPGSGGCCSGGNNPVASQGSLPQGQTLSQNGLPAGGSCGSLPGGSLPGSPLPGGSKLPPVTNN